MPPARLHWLKSLLRATIAPRDRIDRPIPAEDPDGVDRELEREQLTPQELELLRAWRAGQFPDRTASGLLLQHRLNHAVSDASDRTDGGRHEQRQTAKPKFLVLEGGQASNVQSSVLGQLSAAGWLGTGTDGAPLIAPHGSVVLADAKAFEVLRDLPVDLQSIRFAEEGSPPNLPASGGQASVVQADGSLAEFRRLLREALLPQKPARSRAEPDLVGQVLRGKYRIKRFLGKGGFGAVYEAVDEMLGAPVAVKVLHPELEQEPEVLEFFLAEAKLLTNLDHPNIVRWITFDRTDEGLHYFVMEFLRGEELARVLRREKRLEEKRVVDILLQVLAALKAAHRLPDGTSLLHLDLKPQNVFVLPGETEQVKVIDFGVSQHLGVEARPGSGQLVLSKESEKESADLFRTVVSDMATPGPVLGEEGKPIRRARGGTLLYASPEHCRHLKGSRDIVELDGRSDLYSLGVMAFQMLSGELPFKSAARPIDAMQAHFTERPRRLADLGVDVSRGLTAFIERCLAKDRENRFRDAREAYAALNRIARPPSRWPIVASAAGLLAAAAVWTFWPHPKPPPFAIAQSGPVYFGPQRTSNDLELENLLSFDSAKTRVRLVADPQEAAPVLPEWSAALVGTKPPKLHLEAPPDLTERLAERVYAEVTSGERRQLSQAIELIYLGSGALSLDSFSVPEAGQRSVDPVGAELELLVRGIANDIESVEVASGEQWLRASRDDSAAREGPLRFQVPLDKFNGLDRSKPGKATFRARINDRAGGRWDSASSRNHELVLQLEPRALDLSARIKDTPKASANSYFVYPQVASTLECTTQREAKVEVQAGDAEGPAPQITRGESAQQWTLLFPLSAESYFGEIEVVADDSVLVYHGDSSRAREIVKVPFQFEPAAPAFDVRLLGPGGVRLEQQNEEACFARSSPLVLELSGASVPMAVMVFRKRGLDWESIDKRLDLRPQSPPAKLELELDAEGRHEFELRGLRVSGRQLAAGAECTRRIAVILDTQVPQIELETFPAEHAAVHSTSELHWKLAVEDTSSSGAETSPLAVDWTLRSLPPGFQRGGKLDEDMLAAVRDGSLDLSLLEVDTNDLRDGKYELAISVRDAAGNDAVVRASAFEIASKGPAISFLNPSGGQWLASGGNRFPIAAEVSDPNEVQAVECTVRRGEDRRVVALERLEGGNRWSAELELDQEWSEQEVELEFTAVDAYSNPSKTSKPFRTARFEVRPPQRIRLTSLLAPAASITSMRLIEGKTRYVFGGRVAAEEQRTWREYFGSGEDYKDYKLPSLVEDLPVESFYLDETEVSVGQYLAFLEAESGYRNAQHWTAVEPAEERRRELSAQLAELPADLPVTSLTQREASAYAHWVGKRLPKALEWEFAVRGGDAYRPFSSAVRGQRADPSTFNVNFLAEEGRSAWPIGEGSDTTPEGVRDLCSNVSEWTAPDEDGDCFAAGANFESIGATAHVFHKLIRRSPESSLPTLGFRCALDKSEVEKLLKGQAAQSVRAEGDP